MLRKNPKPSINTPVMIPLFRSLPTTIINSEQEELYLMSCTTEMPRDVPPPCLSVDLIKKFLAYVHSFTTIGLEAQATAFSYEPNGVIKYLALLPQINAPDYVDTRPGNVSEFDAVERFAAQEPGKDMNSFVLRCWIHTHPRYKAYMSSKDIIQLYNNARMGNLSFGIVIAPKVKGLKALCVRLTNDGYEKVERILEESASVEPERREVFLSSAICNSSTSFYCQVPFTVSDQPCQVVDLRSTKEVCDQLRSFIENGHPDEDWISPL